MARWAVAASHDGAQASAEKAIGGDGSAIDAVLAGFFHLAALEPGVLLAPVAAVFGGGGSGVRAIDGRPRQPGLGARRPRGLLSGQDVPPAARAAAPRSLAALAVLQAYGGRKTLAHHARTAAKVAAREGAAARAETLERIARLGVPALHTGDALTALLRAAGPGVGGQLRESDLGDPAEDAALFVEGGVGWPSWHEAAAPKSLARRVHAVAAADGRGLVAALVVDVAGDGLEVPELGVHLPANAEPVRRGVPRVTPGSVRPASLPLVLLKRGARSLCAVALTGAHPVLRREDLDPTAPSFDGSLSGLDASSEVVTAWVHEGRTHAQRGRTPAG